VVSGIVSALLVPGAAAADDGGGRCSATGWIAGCLGAKNGTIEVSGEKRRTGKDGSEASVNRTEPVDLEAAAIAAYCADAANDGAASAVAAVTEIVPLCGFAGAPRAAAPPTQGEVLTAFRELGLFRGMVRSDPERVSFVNLETFFWCGDGGRSCGQIGERERTVTLLGQAVRIRPRIVAYEWRFGDGGGMRTTAARVAHAYNHAGAMPVSVTLTWTAAYAVGSGGFQPVDGTTTTTSPVRVLPVQEAQAVSR
jgi:hypothetical protein